MTKDIQENKFSEPVKTYRLHPERKGSYLRQESMPLKIGKQNYRRFTIGTSDVSIAFLNGRSRPGWHRACSTVRMKQWKVI
jgi:hypothetical protein